MSTIEDISAEKRKARMRLTALWALAESGLGGVMFALHLPLTGLIIGAIAVVLLSLIAKYSDYGAGKILESTILVIIVKAAVSPHSPPGAYLAVLLQGGFASLFFGLWKQRQIAFILLAVFSMVESALQKLIILTVVFGNALWSAAEKFVTSTFSFLGGKMPLNFLWICFAFYLLLYAVWGFFVGRFAHMLPAILDENKKSVLEDFKHYLKPIEKDSVAPQTKNKWKNMLMYGVVLALILLVFFYTGSKNKTLIVIAARSIAIIVFIFFILQPIMRLLMERIIRKERGKKSAETNEILQLLPLLRENSRAALHFARRKKGFLNRSKYFLIFMIITGLHAPE